MLLLIMAYRSDAFSPHGIIGARPTLLFLTMALHTLYELHACRRASCFHKYCLSEFSPRLAWSRTTSKRAMEPRAGRRSPGQADYRGSTIISPYRHAARALHKGITATLSPFPVYAVLPRAGSPSLHQFTTLDIFRSILHALSTLGVIEPDKFSIMPDSSRCHQLVAFAFSCS